MELGVGFFEGVFDFFSFEREREMVWYGMVWLGRWMGSRVGVGWLCGLLRVM